MAQVSLKNVSPIRPDLQIVEHRVVDTDNGYTRIANELLEAIARADLTARQLKIMLAYIRKTYGFNKKSDRIADEQVALVTGISRQNVNKAKKELLSMNCLFMDGNQIGVNKVVSAWKFSKCLQVSNFVSTSETKAVSNLETIDVSKSETHKRHSLKTKKNTTPPIVPSGEMTQNITPQVPIASPPPEQPVVDPVRQVFTHWQTEHNHQTAKLDDKRRSRIKARLAQGFSVDELCKAISGAKFDSWLMGKNPSNRRYDGIETLLRDAAQVEKLRDLSDNLHARAIAGGQYTAITARNLDTLQRWAGAKDTGAPF